MKLARLCDKTMPKFARAFLNTKKGYIIVTRLTLNLPGHLYTYPEVLRKLKTLHARCDMHGDINFKDFDSSVYLLFCGQYEL